jgi:hypothetical protein
VVSVETIIHTDTKIRTSVINNVATSVIIAYTTPTTYAPDAAVGNPVAPDVTPKCVTRKSYAATSISAACACFIASIAALHPSIVTSTVTNTITMVKEFTTT